MKKQRKQYNSTLSFIETVLLYDIKFKNIEHGVGEGGKHHIPCPLLRKTTVYHFHNCDVFCL